MKKWSRRDFLKGAAAGTLGVMSAGVLNACQSDAAAKTAAETAADTESGTQESAVDAKETVPSFLTPPEAIGEDEIAETLEADIIVVGSGTSGLCTALSAIEAGGDVILISGSSKPIARGGSNHAVNSKYMREHNLKGYDITAVTSKEFVANSGQVDARKWYKFYNHSEEAMDWLIDIMEGAGYETAIEINAQYEKDSPYFTPPHAHGWVNEENRMIGMTQDFVVNTLAEKVAEEGGTIFYNTVARQLVRGGQPNGKSGRVEAVIAEREDGSYVKYVGKKGIVLATGDFSADREMMETYCPQAIPFCNPETLDGEANYDNAFTTGGLYKGDGQKMGLWVGAAWQHNIHNAPMWVSAGSATANVYSAHWGLKLNARGERFMNEDTTGAYAAFATMSQRGDQVFAIWDDDYAKGEENWYAMNVTYDADPMTEEEIKSTWGDSYDTLEEAIESLKLPLEETKATIARYNELCEKGEDTDFYKTAKKMKPIQKAPFHTGFETIFFYTVCGGLRTGIHMEVCDEQDEPIPGLYNVGMMVGDMYSNLYSFFIQGFNYGATCITFGYLTGKYIMEQE